MGFFARASAPRPAPAIAVEALETRDVPSTVDLTARGATGSVNGALFTQAQARPSGTGVIDSFVRVQALGNRAVEEGYNTSARPLAYDENNSPNFTRTLAVAAVPAVTVGGAAYREFLLDINQKASASVLSLDAVKVFVSDTPNLSGKLDAAGNLPGATLKYDLGAGNWVKLDARLSTGSGSSDMVLDVPEAALAGGRYVYLYSKFGAAVAANGGFEEWAVRGAGGGPVAPAGGAVTAAITFNGVTVPDGTTVQMVLNGTVVDEQQTVNGQVTFHNVLLDGNTGYTFVLVGNPASPINGQYFGPDDTSTTLDFIFNGGG